MVNYPYNLFMDYTGGNSNTYYFYYYYYGGMRLCAFSR
ncbi:hypothetical protein SAMN04489760_103157 [Syntrophus gentianae]|uniref:Uncharacterized protein n=1 Tax=Syntrophus gentianae TaxID=43775 RepID=A0A1H7VBK4_9BACT|nr:hypothetical protein SAMN04489760_103157 [Syntrophus gentianae]